MLCICICIHIFVHNLLILWWVRELTIIITGYVTVHVHYKYSIVYIYGRAVRDEQLDVIVRCWVIRFNGSDLDLFIGLLTDYLFRVRTDSVKGIYMYIEKTTN